MSSVPFYAINTSCRMAECPRSPIRFKNRVLQKGTGELQSPAYSGSSSVIKEDKDIKDTASMMHITRKQYEQREIVSAFDVFN